MITIELSDDFIDEWERIKKIALKEYYSVDTQEVVSQDLITLVYCMAATTAYIDQNQKIAVRQ